MKHDFSECIINAEMLILMKICPITILMYAYTLYIYIPYKKPEYHKQWSQRPDATEKMLTNTLNQKDKTLAHVIYRFFFFS